jgi:hypothetical protein
MPDAGNWNGLLELDESEMLRSASNQSQAMLDHSFFRGATETLRLLQ